MKRTWRIVILSSIILYFMLLFMANSVQAQSLDYSFIKVEVIDNLTNRHIENAEIQVWDTSKESYFAWKLSEITKTDVNGQSNIKVKAGSDYGVYAYYDDPDTLGFDYVPMFKNLTSFEGNVTIIFRLIPAMSILFTGELRFTESTKPSTFFLFNVRNNLSSSDCEYVHNFGSYPPCHDFLNLSSKYVIIPLNIDTYIEVNAEVFVEKEQMMISKNFTISDLNNFDLEKGKLIQVNIEKYSLKYILDELKKNIVSIEEILKKVEQTGFYITLEKQDLAASRNILGIAETMLSEVRYDDSYANLREAYIKNVEVSKRLKDIYTNASASVFALVLFLSLTSCIVANVISERLLKRSIITILFFTIFIAILYYAYPGCYLVSPITLLEYFTLASVISTFLTIIFPFILREQFTSTFSLAKRHLKQRKLRFLLTLVSITVLAMSFVSLTSFSTGYGLITKSIYTFFPNPIGLLLKEPLNSDSERLLIKFLPIDQSAVNLIQKDNEIRIIAPKAESLPQFKNIGLLSSINNPSKNLPLFGILGFKPSAEAEITHLNETIVEGRYLKDDDQNSVLISIDAAKTLDVKIGNRLKLTAGIIETEVVIVGFFDDSLLNMLREVNGESLLPQKLSKIEGDPMSEFYLKTCKPNEIIITPLEFSLKMQGVQLSRIDALSINDEVNLSLGRRLALELDLLVVYSSGNMQYTNVLGYYLETKGLSILIPWIIVILSVIITMLNSIFEQRREIAILSSIGLNPSHIMGLFIAEAAIIGIIGGGVGYLLGLGNYRLMSMFSVIVEVRSKISAIWSIAAILFSLSTVIVGAIVALRFSTVITPSLLRRWSFEERKTPANGEAFTLEMPFRIQEEEVDSMLQFVFNYMKGYLEEHELDKYIEGIKLFEEKTVNTHIKGFRTRYIPAREVVIGGVPFDFTAVKKTDEDNYSIKIVFKQFYAHDESTYKTVSFIRMALVKWSSFKKVK